MTQDPPLAQAPFTYSEVGATRRGPLPAGYRHLTYRVELRTDSVTEAAEHLLTWRMHRAAGLRVTASAPQAAPGVRVVQRIGVWPLRLSAPCQVVWAVATDDLAGFAYGTLPGHPAIGEESFVVSRDASGAVWFTITSFSLPARWYMRLAGPVAPLLQRAFAHHCGRVLRSLSSPG